MDVIGKFFNEDVLAGVESLSFTTRGHKFTKASNQTRINLKIILLLSVVLAISRIFYGPAETDLLQHFVATFAILLAFYLVLGGVLLVFPASHNYIRQYAATIYLCLFAAGIFYFASVLLFGAYTGKLGSFTVPLMNWIDDQLPESWNDSITLITLEKWFTAILFALIGSLAILRSNMSRSAQWIGKYLICSFCTGLIFYVSVCERDGFFDNVASLLSKLKLWA